MRSRSVEEVDDEGHDRRRGQHGARHRHARRRGRTRSGDRRPRRGASAHARGGARWLGDRARAERPAERRGRRFAVYYPAIKDAVHEYADRVEGKVVVDITNPVDTETGDDLATPAGTSSAEEVARLLPDGTPVVKAFNTTFAPTLVAGEVGGQQLDVLIAGDDDEAKRKVAQLVTDGGLRPLDVGPLRRARQLEQLGFLHIAVQQPLGLGFGSAIKLHP